MARGAVHDLYNSFKGMIRDLAGNMKIKFRAVKNV